MSAVRPGKQNTFFDPEIYYRKVEAAGENSPGDATDTGREGEKTIFEEDKKNATDRQGNDGREEDDDGVTVEIDNLRDWDIQLADPPASDVKRGVLRQFKQSKIGAAFKLNESPRFIVSDFDGLMEYSHMQSGDRLLSINKRTVDPRVTTARAARDCMTECMETEGVLNVVTENPGGDDILINVTIIKPRRDMTYDELGLVVWNWPYLCVRQIREGSIFEHTPVRETDQIAAVNDIDCGKMRPGAFAKCVEELPTELTITLIRRKHRYTGSFK